MKCRYLQMNLSYFQILKLVAFTNNALWWTLCSSVYGELIPGGGLAFHGDVGYPGSRLSLVVGPRAKDRELGPLSKIRL